MNGAQAMAVQLLTAERLGLQASYTHIAKRILAEGYLPKYSAGELSICADRAVELINEKGLQDKALKIAKTIMGEYGVT